MHSTGHFELRLLIAVIILAICPMLNAADDPKVVFESLYGEQVRQAASTHQTDDDVALAQQLHKAAITAKADPALMAVLCENAYEFGRKDLKGYNAAIAAMQLLAEQQPDRVSDCREKMTDLYERLYRNPRLLRNVRVQAGQRWVQTLMQMAEDHIAADEFAQAHAMLRKAQPIASTTAPKQVDAIRRRLIQVAEAMRTFKQIDQLKGRLKANPDDHATGDQLVRTYLVQLDDPMEAQKYTFLTNDESLKQFVSLANQSTDLSHEQLLTLGDGYRDLADQAEGNSQSRMFMRAQQAYAQYLKAHTEEDADRLKATLAQQMVESTLKKIGRAPAPIGSTPPDTEKTTATNGTGASDADNAAQVPDPIAQIYDSLPEDARPDNNGRWGLVAQSRADAWLQESLKGKPFEVVGYLLNVQAATKDRAGNWYIYVHFYRHTAIGKTTKLSIISVRLQDGKEQDKTLMAMQMKKGQGAKITGTIHSAKTNGDELRFTIKPANITLVPTRPGEGGQSPGGAIIIMGG
ncbi:hypothetical protein HED60_00785 [Planctomycetales bacterium ZRK34]|nr:hypothetical protein HED60_00785 [Planctomycetales bacterium ZRK34]